MLKKYRVGVIWEAWIMNYNMKAKDNMLLFPRPHQCILIQENYTSSLPREKKYLIEIKKPLPWKKLGALK